MLLLVLLACQPDKPDDTALDTGGSDTEESATDSETGETAESGETGETAETGDSGETGETGETGDTGTPDPDWAHCPGPEVAVGDASWTGLAEVTAGATWCGISNEERTLEQELAAKALLRLVPGDYPLPGVDGDYDLALPACVRRADPATQPVTAGAGGTTVTAHTYGRTTYTYVEGGWPMLAPDSSTWTLSHTLLQVGAKGGPPDPLLLDGGPGDSSTGAGASFVLHDDLGSRYDLDATTFGACMQEDWHENVHHVVFAGGEVTLRLWLGDSFDLTGPSAFVSAEGTLDGEAFAVEDYFALVYRPGHHNFERDFAVLLSEPVGEACALRIEDVDGLEDTVTAVVSTADCDLGVVEVRSTKAETLEVSG